MAETMFDVTELQMYVTYISYYNMSLSALWFAFVALAAMEIQGIVKEKGGGGGFLLLITILLILCLAHFFLAIWLYMGARDKDVVRCSHWIYFSIVEDFLVTILFLFLLILKRSWILALAQLGIAAFTQGFQIWLVAEYKEAIIREQTEAAVQAIGSFISNLFSSS